MVGGPLRPPQEVMFVVTVPFEYCGELPRAQKLVFKHCFVFPDLFPAEVLCEGKEASPQGRGQEMGANSSCFIICPFMEEGIRFRQFHFGKEVKGKQLSFSAQREEALQD